MLTSLEFIAAGIASAATAVLIGHVAAGTSTIRVGAGSVTGPKQARLPSWLAT